MSFPVALITLVLIVLTPLCHAYIDLSLANAHQTQTYIPRIPTPTPHQIRDIFFREELQQTRLPSMITAVAPSLTMAANGTFETLYSMHYHDFFVRQNVGKGVFKRGVFESDPPIATCTPCGGAAATSAAVNTTTTGPVVSCTTELYSGVFRSNVGPQSAATSSYCYDSSYSGVLQPSSISSTGLPCCFTIPASCLSNYSMSSSMSMTYSSGVFRSNFSSTLSSTVFSSTTASPSSSRGLSTASSTGRSSSGSSTGVFLGSSRSSTGLSRTSSTSTTRSASSSLDPGLSSASSIALSSISSTTSSAEITSVTVISSSTVIVTVSASPSGAGGQDPRPGNPTSTSQVTLSIVTVIPSSQSLSPIVTTIPNTVDGCGSASGSGVVVGTGTVYVGAGLIPVVSSGTVSGFASKVVGCGTLIATSGSFSGSATIIGCGSGSGTATMTGSGTVWPAAFGGLISFVSSGTVTGSGRVEGCGTMTGSGTFTASQGLTTTFTPPPPLTKVEVFVSYCPIISGMGMPRIGDNSTYIAPVTISSLAGPSTALRVTSNTTLENPLCKICPNDEGICCPLRVACNSGDGHCPWTALRGAGYVLAGYNVVAQQNSTGAMRIKF